MEQKIIIGTRGSELALWQAYFVKEMLSSQGVDAELKIIKTQGDKIQHLSFDKMEGKGFFTKEIESALLAKEVDLAIHSFKDLETNDPEGLEVVCMPQRTVPNDLLIMQKTFAGTQPKDLPKGFVIGTSSARRKNQWLALHPESEIKDLRGNVPTRIQKLREGQYDGIILAAAGVKRLEIDLSEFEVVNLQDFNFVPAPAQGALGIQIRSADTQLRSVLQPCHDEQNWIAVELERSLLNWVNGGCHIPLGVHVAAKNGKYSMDLSFATAEAEPRELLSLESDSIEFLRTKGREFIDQCRSKS